MIPQEKTLDSQKTLSERFDEFVSLVVAEFDSRRQDANAVLSTDPAIRKVRANLRPNDEGGETFTLTVSESDLLGGDLRELAKAFVSEYRVRAGSMP